MKLARSATRARARYVLLGLLPAGVLACGTPLGGPGAPPEDFAITLTDVLEDGDDRRRASNHLVDEGLEADDLADAGRALDRYELALKIDPANPWAYLALARHELEDGEPRRALASLDRCRSLLESYGELSPRVETHLFGLRGGALEALGRDTEAYDLLAEARRRAPDTWGDGMLAASELR